MTEFKTNPIMMAVSTELLEQANAMRESMAKYMAATPEQRAAWAAEASAQRLAERSSASLATLTLEALIEALGISRGMAEHLVQTYCQCHIGADGWDHCAHARDLGIDW